MKLERNKMMKIKKRCGNESIDTSIEKPTAAAGTLFNCDFLNLNKMNDVFIFFE